MKILITGAAGFTGRYTAEECAAAGHEVCGQDIENSEGIRQCDLRDGKAVSALVEKLRPEACIHLAGISDVPAGWKHPGDMYSANLLGTVNLLEAFRCHAPAARILAVSSAQIYETIRVYDDFNEKVHFLPSNIYAISKLAADLTVRSYAEKYGLPAFTARPVNHIGPGQSPRFVTAAFAARLKRIASGEQSPVMKVGNLDSRRDFLDVRDVARAYRLLIEKGAAGEYYNISSGQLVAIKKILSRLAAIAGVEPETETDPALFRPTDSSPRLDTAKLEKQTGWRPEIDLDRTLRDLYDSIEI